MNALLGNLEVWEQLLPFDILHDLWSLSKPNKYLQFQEMICIITISRLPLPSMSQWWGQCRWKIRLFVLCSLFCVVRSWPAINMWLKNQKHSGLIVYIIKRCFISENLCFYILVEFKALHPTPWVAVRSVSGKFRLNLFFFFNQHTLYLNPHKTMF